MSMTKRDFEALAQALKSAHSGPSARIGRNAAVRVVNNLLPHLRSVNAAFDDERFILACGLDVATDYSHSIADPRFILCA